MRFSPAHMMVVALMVALAGGAGAAELPAFPGAEGEGCFTAGGRGGDVYRVTTLADAGEGSLRNGLDSMSGPRTIVFEVGGTIALERGLAVRKLRLTIAGETAPGQGIVLVHYGLGIGAPQVIVRHVRVRPGDARMGRSAARGFDGDAISINAADVILDHVSTSWAIDENLSVAGRDAQRITVQYATISECLAQTGLWHGEENERYAQGGAKRHSMGSLIKPGEGDGRVSFHHNLWSNNGNRNPALGNYRPQFGMQADLRANVIYNNISNGYTSGESRRVELNYVGNTIIAGPDTSKNNAAVAFRTNAANRVHIFQVDNRIDSNRDGALDGQDLGFAMIAGDYERAETPFAMQPVSCDSAEMAYENVLDGAGACPWNRDAVDRRLVDEVRRQRGQIIDSQDDVGGYPQLPSVIRPADWDTDKDGMPNAWETAQGLNPNVADNNGDVDGDGYTNLEEYLHAAAEGPAAGDK
ncbi:MAG: hypothetical protein WD845_04480 [Pirellulales bacterium]